MIQLVSDDGKTRASINPIGAALLGVWVDGNQIVGAPDKFSGVMLFPWPNRIQNGAWSFGDQDLALPINDLEANAALHGLVFAQAFDIQQVSDTRVTLAATLSPSTGFPFSFRLSATFELLTNRVLVGYAVENDSVQAAPFAIGFHPYFVADEDSVLRIASSKIAISGQHFDETFGPGLDHVTLETNNYALKVSAHGAEYFHVFTDRYSSKDQLWLAIEPQTAPANSLKTGVGMVVLEPHERRDFVFELTIQ